MQCYAIELHHFIVPCMYVFVNKQVSYVTHMIQNFEKKFWRINFANTFLSDILCYICSTVLYMACSCVNVLCTCSDGGIEEMVNEMSNGKMLYAYLKVMDPNTSLPKSVLVNWVCTTLFLSLCLFV